MHEKVKGNKLILFTEKLFLFTVQSKMRFIQKCLQRRFSKKFYDFTKNN